MTDVMNVRKMHLSPLCSLKNNVAIFRAVMNGQVPARIGLVITKNVQVGSAQNSCNDLLVCRPTKASGRKQSAQLGKRIKDDLFPLQFAKPHLFVKTVDMPGGRMNGDGVVLELQHRHEQRNAFRAMLFSDHPTRQIANGLGLAVDHPMAANCPEKPDHGTVVN